MCAVRQRLQDRVLPIILACGIVFSAATQLRLPGIPFGPGEALLLLWAGLVVGGLLQDRRFPIQRYAVPVLSFWMIGLAILCFDLIVFSTIKGPQTLSAYAMVAYLFCFALCLVWAQHGNRSRIEPAVTALVFATTAPLAILFLLAEMGTPVRIVDPWYSFRFCGWSNNPNQLAFQLAALPFLALFCAKRAPRRRTRLMLLGAIVTSFIVGVATFSDALVVAWIAGCLAAIAIEYLLVRRANSAGAQWRSVVRYVVVPLLVVASLLAFGLQIYDSVRSGTRAMYEERGQGAERVDLLWHGIEASLVSPLTGLGPGAHSGVVAPFRSTEAHNSIVDWGTNTGALGLLALVVLLGWIAGQLVRAASPELWAAFVALVVFSLFHYTFRHPTFWFELMFIAGLAYHSRREETTSGQRGS